MTATLLALVVVVVGGFMADEVKAWSRWLHLALRRRAVASLPEKCRARYDEEWERELEEIPGEILKLFYSVGLLRAAVGIRGAAFASAAGLERPLPLVRRLFEIALSAIALILFAPLFLEALVFIKLSGPGPAFLFSERVGRKGRVFRSVRFRTLAHRVEDQRPGIAQLDQGGAKPLEAGRYPRVTRVGHVLRLFSADEMPQLLNVLRGDMSFDEMCYCGPDDPLVHLTPGLTGLWRFLSSEKRSPVFFKVLGKTFAVKWLACLNFKLMLRWAVISFAGMASDAGPGTHHRGGHDDGGR